MNRINLSSLTRIGLIIFCTVSSFVFFNNPIFAAEQKLAGRQIASVKVAGNVSISENEIFSAVSIREGHLFDSQRAAQETQKIAKLEGVSYCYYNAELVSGKVELTFVVVEKDLIRSIEFAGNDKINDRSLSNKNRKLSGQTSGRGRKGKAR